MEPENAKKPAAVIATTVIFGILSFFTSASPEVAGDQTGLAMMLRKAVCLVGFIAALLGTLLGRKIVIGVLSLLLFGSAAGYYTAIRKFPSDVVGALIVALVASLPVLWFYWYTFGSASRRYFQGIRAGAHNHSLQARRP